MAKNINLTAAIVLMAISFVAGVLTRHYNIPPIPQVAELKNQLLPLVRKALPPNKLIEIVAYKKHTTLYVDRPYFETLGVIDLKGAYLVKIERHRKIPIKLHVISPVVAFRFINDGNDNSVFDGWTRTSDEVFVNGQSSQDNIVIRKQFEPGIHLIAAGGPVSSSPLLIKAFDRGVQRTDFEIQN